MKPVKLLLLGGALLPCMASASAAPLADAAPAASSASAPAEATPIGSPADWLNLANYPPVASRFDMAGTTGFQLAIGVDGKPTGCEVVASSGFDVLDTAACERLMANAAFTPARGAAGEAVPGSYSSRVVWTLGAPDQEPIVEQAASVRFSIDPVGRITSCSGESGLPASVLAGAGGAEARCPGWISNMPADFLQNVLGAFPADGAELEFRQAVVFTPELRARAAAPMPGYQQVARNVHRFTVTSEGKLGECRYEEQRGSTGIIRNVCAEIAFRAFDPPFSAVGKDGTVTGWNIVVVMLKTGQ